MITEDPGYDAVALTRPVGPHLCNSRSCAVQNTLAEVICDHAGVPARAAAITGQAMTVLDNTPSQGGSGDDVGRWREAARLRSQFRGWIVIWLAPEGCYKAYRRLPGARRDTALSAATAAEMADLIARAEQAATARPARRGSGTS